MTGPFLTVHLDLENPTDEIQIVRLEKGRCFEILYPEGFLQNAMLAEDSEVIIPPGGRVAVDLPAFCLNKYRSMTLSKHEATVTPFLFTHPCDDQEKVWNIMANPAGLN